MCLDILGHLNIIIDDFIEKDYETLIQKKMYEVYQVLREKCLELGYIPPSYKTFRKRLKMRPQYEQTLKRQGKRAAYQKATFYWRLSIKTPKHGERPFEVGHIDHTELAIELISSETKRNIGKAWLTLMVDAYSRKILAIYITFDAPSYRSCMMVMRECVRRHGRLPEKIVVDNGKEFSSTYFETILAFFGITKMVRPPAHPRFGSICERLFGTTETQFINNLSGNTQLMKKVRLVTKKVNPKNQSIWTLELLYNQNCEYAYNVYNKNDHPALGVSPDEAFEKGIEKYGKRPNRYIPYNDDFLILTMPSTKNGTAKIDPQRGVKIKYIYYWHNDFRDPKISKTQVPVRFDPFNMRFAYAYVNNRWVKCESEYPERLDGLTEKEIIFATEELRKKHSSINRNYMINAKRLVEFLESLKNQEKSLRAEKDEENKKVFGLILGKRPVIKVIERKMERYEEDNDEDLDIYDRE